MSTEQRKGMVDIFKILMFISLSISGFLIASKYNEQTEKFDEQHEEIKLIRSDLRSIEARTIRIEYELKLK